MVTATQRNLLVFLCIIIFLTVIAVLAANLGFPNESATTQSFAKWGLGAVLVEIVGLFVFVAKGIFQRKANAYSLVVGMPKELASLDVSQIAWDQKNCFLVLLTTKEEERFRIIPVAGALAPNSWEIKLPSTLSEKITETDPVYLLLTDSFGNRWEVGSFYLFQRSLSLKAPDKLKLKADYGYADE